MLKNAFSASNSTDKNIDLLTALKPHLNEKNQSKIDQSIKLMRLLALVPLLKELGIFGGDLLWHNISLIAQNKIWIIW